jgi:predicted ATP-dependent serine protease
MKVCASCGKGASILDVNCLNCGLNWLVPNPVRVGKPMGAARPIDVLACAAPLGMTCGGGFMRHGLVAVTGPAGAGKSTEVCAAVLALGLPAVWLDGEQTEGQCLAMGQRAGSLLGWSDAHTAAAMGTGGFVMRVPAQRWSEAREAARGARVVVIDSVDEWAGPKVLSGRRRLLKDARRLAASADVVFLIVHYTRQNKPKGGTLLDHFVDALVVVEPKRLWQRKTRWAPPLEVGREALIA